MLVFVLIAVSTVVVPVVLYNVMGERAQPILDSMRTWLTQNNATVMAVLLLVIGVVRDRQGASRRSSTDRRQPSATTRNPKLPVELSGSMPLRADTR